MRSTILSENQYDPAFIISANANAITRPCCPPSASPIARNRRLISVSSSAVLNQFVIMMSVSV